MFGNRSKRPSPSEFPGGVPIVQNLVDIGGDLSVPELLRAYRAGNFPWTVHPVTWWSPDPRAIFEFEKFHVPRSLKRFLRQNPFQITIDRAFRKVMQGCATPARHRPTSWITGEFVNAYTALYERGYGHSIEVWRGEELVGGLYGLAIGGYFVGESMFHKVSNASKVALFYMVQHLKARGYTLFDVQMPTDATLQMGVVLVPRKAFLSRLKEAVDLPVTFGTTLEGEIPPLCQKEHL